MSPNSSFPWKSTEIDERDFCLVKKDKNTKYLRSMFVIQTWVLELVVSLEVLGNPRMCIFIKLGI